MNLRSALRERRSGAASSSGGSEAAGDDGGPPFADYDRLNSRQVIERLRTHSQLELEEIEGYERAHMSRVPVLNKLRYMRGREPMAGYDALSLDEVVAALEGANLGTIKKVRAYERKFGNRPGVLAAVTRDLPARQQT